MRGLAFVLGAILLGSIIAVPAYFAGLAQAGAPATAVSPYAYAPWHFGFFGFGFLFPLLFLFLIFGLARAAFGGGRWGGGHHGYGRGYPAPFEEWHRRAHGGTQEEQAKPSGSGGSQSRP